MRGTGATASGLDAAIRPPVHSDVVGLAYSGTSAYNARFDLDLVLPLSAQG
jgi:hypothetical protein